MCTQACLQVPPGCHPAYDLRTTAARYRRHPAISHQRRHKDLAPARHCGRACDQKKRIGATRSKNNQSADAGSKTPLTKGAWARDKLSKLDRILTKRPAELQSPLQLCQQGKAWHGTGKRADEARGYHWLWPLTSARLKPRPCTSSQT